MQLWYLLGCNVNLVDHSLSPHSPVIIITLTKSLQCFNVTSYVYELLSKGHPNEDVILSRQISKR